MISGGWEAQSVSWWAEKEKEKRKKKVHGKTKTWKVCEGGSRREVGGGRGVIVLRISVQIKKREQLAAWP